MDILERLAKLEQCVATEYKYSAKRNRIMDASNPSDNTRLAALEKIVGINNEVTLHE